MVDGLATAIIVTALAAAVLSGLTALLDRPPGPMHLAGLVVVEVVLLVQTVVAMAKVFTGDRPDALATFVGYLIATVLMPPLAGLIGLTERTRWGSAIIAGAFLVVPVMVVRLQQVWTATA